MKFEFKTTSEYIAQTVGVKPGQVPVELQDSEAYGHEVQCTVHTKYKDAGDLTKLHKVVQKYMVKGDRVDAQTAVRELAKAIKSTSKDPVQIYKDRYDKLKELAKEPFIHEVDDSIEERKSGVLQKKYNDAVAKIDFLETKEKLWKDYMLKNVSKDLYMAVIAAQTKEELSKAATACENFLLKAQPKN